MAEAGTTAALPRQQQPSTNSVILMDSPQRRIIRVKRKASEPPVEPLLATKRFKFIGSTNKSDEEAVRELVVTKAPKLIQLDDDDITITDFEDFVHPDDKSSSFVNPMEVITCNGIPLIPAPRHVGLELERSKDDDEDDGDDRYIYDVYLFDGSTQPEEEELLNEDPFKECRENDYSSNDEDNPDNDYPDEEDYDYQEYDYYRDWEDDETRDMMRDFERNCINPDDDSEDEEWAEKEDNS